MRVGGLAIDAIAGGLYTGDKGAFAATDLSANLGDGDALKVVDVASGSAAPRAGLKPGDRIVSIGDEKIAAHRLPEWRERLRTLPAGTKLAVDCLRDGKPAKAELVLAGRVPARAALSK